MSDPFEFIKTITFEDANWHLVQPFDDKDVALTAKNRGNTPVSVFCTSEDLTEETVGDYLQTNNINPAEIGGTFYEISSQVASKMFIKCPSGAGTVSIRVYGTVDPMEDIQALGQIVTAQGLDLAAHKNDKKNPHAVDKTQVGLDQIPNAVSQSYKDLAKDDTQSLVSLAALKEVQTIAQNHIDLVKGNPHKVTKDEVGLGKVPNYPAANAKQAIDYTNDSTLLTPKMGALIVKDIVVVASSMKPQMVIAGQILSRPSGWTMKDITPPAGTIAKGQSREIVIKSGLQVSYAYRGMCRVSKVLADNMFGLFKDQMPNGIHYIYVDLDNTGKITGWGSTTYKPQTSTGIDAVDGDYYNYAQCTMQHANGSELIRVYIGKVMFSNNEWVDTICVPLGDSAIIPVTSQLDLGKSMLLSNPFCMPVKTTALIELDQRWGETEWNDQIGVKAHPRPGFELDQIVLQAGTIGYLTKGSSAGGAFGSEFVTITDPKRLAIQVERTH